MENLGLGKLLPRVSCPSLLDAATHLEGGDTLPNVQIRTQEPFSHTEIEVTKRGCWFFLTLVDAYEFGVPQKGHLRMEVAKGKRDELAS